MTEGDVTCLARAGRTALAPARIGIAKDTAICGWRIPKTAAKKLVRGSVAVKVGKARISRAFSRRVARR